MASAPPPRSTANDDGRLPWLDAAPAAEAGSQPGAAAGWSPLRWLIGLLAVALVAAAAFLLGRRSDEPAPPRVPPPPLATTRLNPARPAPNPPPDVEQTAPALARAESQHAAAPAPAAPEKPLLHLRPEQIRDVRRIVRRAHVEVHRNAVPRAVARPAYAPRVGPSGRVVQLGAYHTVAEAEEAAQRFRYKYRGLLAPLPKAVLPFRPKNSRRMFYRVQFVTPSQAYAEVTCQRLRAAEKSCIVVY